MIDSDVIPFYSGKLKLKHDLQWSDQRDPVLLMTPDIAEIQEERVAMYSVLFVLEGIIQLNLIRPHILSPERFSLYSKSNLAANEFLTQVFGTSNTNDEGLTMRAMVLSIREILPDEENDSDADESFNPNDAGSRHPLASTPYVLVYGSKPSEGAPMKLVAHLMFDRKFLVFGTSDFADAELSHPVDTDATIADAFPTLVDESLIYSEESLPIYDEPILSARFREIERIRAAGQTHQTVQDRKCFAPKKRAPTKKIADIGDKRLISGAAAKNNMSPAHKPKVARRKLDVPQASKVDGSRAKRSTPKQKISSSKKPIATPADLKPQERAETGNPSSKSRTSRQTEAEAITDYEAKNKKMLKKLVWSTLLEGRMDKDDSHTKAVYQYVYQAIQQILGEKIRASLLKSEQCEYLVKQHIYFHQRMSTHVGNWT
ncbi:hypothetical protein EC973_005217 [Apophysomyces ossiformis]|uniref:Sld7 C-terminal domain-containing protein n=1 Tax=Apophysomyces ossiformis TaxID=679940 RepID=A0A8H7EU62_9FUNG|nr:hypothetical protein EC973_005217 [Apophysomyces ossiformis]